MLRRVLALLIAALLVAPPLFPQQERKRGVATTIKFELTALNGIDFATATCATQAGTANDDVQISKDEGTFADSTNCFTPEGNGDYSLVLTAAEMTAQRITISVKDFTSTMTWLPREVYVETYGPGGQHAVDRSAAGFAASVQALLTGSVDSSTFTPTATGFEAASIVDAAGTNYADDVSSKFTGDWIKFTSGSLAGQKRQILSHTLVGGKARFQVDTMPSTPSNGDTFIIL